MGGRSLEQSPIIRGASYDEAAIHRGQQLARNQRLSYTFSRHSTAMRGLIGNAPESAGVPVFTHAPAFQNSNRREAIRATRKERGLSQERLAEGADLSTVFISRVECGKESPSVDSLVKIARALGLKVSELTRDF